MLLKDIMSRDVTTIDSEATIREAAQTMKAHDVGFLPVLHESVCAGVITDRDIVVRVIADGLDPNTTTVAMVMSHGVPTAERHQLRGNASVAALHEDATVEDAVDLMNKLDVQRLAVYDTEEHVIGIISRHDLASPAEPTTRQVHQAI